ncbi:MAG: hypothetical protein K940chlam8_00548 [Chlamydiae bacterium]|nr:hypothetical protein [Chlamydiota bacterium]
MTSFPINGTTLVPHYLRSHQAVTTLDLTQRTNPLIDGEFADLVADYPNLTFLALDVSSLSGEFFYQLQRLERLTDLHLVGSCSREFFLAGDLNFPAIQSLVLDGLDVSEGVLEFIGDHLFPNVQELHLKNVSVLRPAELMCIKFFSNLIFLKVEEMRLGDSFFGAVAGLTQLEQLGISGSNIGVSMINAKFPASLRELILTNALTPFWDTLGFQQRLSQVVAKLASSVMVTGFDTIGLPPIQAPVILLGRAVPRALFV